MILRYCLRRAYDQDRPYLLAPGHMMHGFVRYSQTIPEIGNEMQSFWSAVLQDADNMLNFAANDPFAGVQPDREAVFDQAVLLHGKPSADQSPVVPEKTVKTAAIYAVGKGRFRRIGDG